MGKILSRTSAEGEKVVFHIVGFVVPSKTSEQEFVGGQFTSQEQLARGQGKL
jgi:hypothetical protein